MQTHIQKFNPDLYMDYVEKGMTIKQEIEESTKIIKEYIVQDQMTFELFVKIKKFYISRLNFYKKKKYITDFEVNWVHKGIYKIWFINGNLETSPEFITIRLF